MLLNNRDSVHNVDEIAEIFAAGWMRLQARKSSELSAHRGESSLHFSPDQSAVRPVPENGERR
jgi:hypothetical protein